MLTPAELIAKADRPSADALRLHPLYKGKVQMMPKCPIRSSDDWAIWYTPGVAAACKAIAKRPDLVFDYTNKGNTIAIVSDGTRVLGLGDIGPEAGLPVMEGKALLFKYLGGVDAVPLCVRTRDAGDLIHVVKALAPSFGGINLEDIAQPKCFRVLDALRAELDIPVWHDDQQGTATVVMAGLFNALKLVNKDIGRIKIAIIGIGAANVATYRLLKSAGASADQVIACDSVGTLHSRRRDLEERQAEFPDKWRVCVESNADRVSGGIREALHGADVCLAFSRSGPSVIDPAWVKSMAADAIVFACANPVPEIWPWEAQAAGARIVATGRSDFPNQVNNALAFPGIFRGVLDVRARTITDEMAMAAAGAIATIAEAAGLRDDRILPAMDDPAVPARAAVATAAAAERQGIAALRVPPDDLHQRASEAISRSQRAMRVLLHEGIIAQPP